MDNILIGKTITGLRITDDKIALLFNTEDGDVKASCDADCCSFTWIEHIELPALGFPAKVMAVEDLEMPDLGDMPECEVVAYYGLKITTSKGEVIIDYRNDSNGDYGGSLLWPKDMNFHDGVYGQNVSREIWIEVNSDI